MFHPRKIVDPISVGLGGPLSCLLSAASGINKCLPFWVLCPLCCIFIAPITILCPVLLPLYLLRALQTRVRDFYGLESDGSNAQMGEHLANKADKAIAAAAAAAADNAGKDDSDARDANASDTSDVRDERGEREQLKADVYDKERDIKEEQDALHSMGLHVAKLHLGMSIRTHLGSLLCMLLCYYLVALGVYFFSSHYMNKALYRYIDIATSHKVLQIATPEQIEYANSVMVIWTLAGATMVFMALICFVFTLMLVLNYENKAKAAAALILKNLPGFMVIGAIFYAIVVIVERYYAHFRVISVEAMIRDVEYFDPTVPFILLRLYISHVLVVCLVLTVLMAMRIIPRHFIKIRRPAIDPSPRPPR